MKIFKVFICIFSLFTLNTMQPMGKTFAKKAFEKACTAAGWGIAAGPLWLGAAGGSVLLAADTSPDKSLLVLKTPGLPDQPIFVPVSKEMDALVQQQAQAVGINHPVIVKTFNPEIAHTPAVETLKTALGHSPAFAIGKTIFITNEQQPIPFYVLPKETDPLIKNNALRFFIQHEANHVKNSDSLKRAGVAATLPLLTHYGIKLLTRGRAPKSTLGHLKKIPAGFGKLFMNTGAFLAYSRYTEQRADDGVNDTKEILTGGHSVFQKAHNDGMPIIEKILPDNPQVSPAVSQKMRSLLYYVSDPTHPTFLARAKKLDARLKKLEAAEASATRKA